MQRGLLLISLESELGRSGINLNNHFTGCVDGENVSGFNKLLLVSLGS